MALGIGLSLTDFGSVGGISDAADGGFTPLSLTPWGWWDVSDLSTLFQERSSPSTPSVVNGVVGTVLDKSGNLRHLTAGAADTRRPILRQSGAVYWLEFDGTDDVLNVASTLAQPVTRVSAFEQITWTVNDYLFDGNGGATQTIYQAAASPNLTTYGGSVLAISGGALSTPLVSSEVWNGASSKFAINNGSYTTGNPGAVAPQGFNVGGNASSSSHANMKWFGSFIKDAVVADADILRLRTHFGSKAGIAL